MYILRLHGKEQDFFTPYDRVEFCLS